MSRTVRDSKLETREARRRLPAQSKPHWRTLRPGQLHLGYCRRRSGAAGFWTVRTYVGVRPVGSPYRVEKLPGVADDFEDPNGVTVLSYAQAQDKALARQNMAQGTTGPLTVDDAMADYLKYLHLEKRTGGDAEQRAKALITPELGSIMVGELTTSRLLRWRDALAEDPARLRTAKGESQKSRKAAKTDDARRARRAPANRTLTILKGALNRAFKHGLVDDDLSWRRLKPFENVHAARPGHLTVAEAKRLINAADADSGFRDLVRAALTTGCRYGELCALRVRDFHRGKIAIHHSKSGKARDVVLNAEGVALFEQLTAGRARDEVLLPNRGRAARALEREREQLRKQGKPAEKAKIKDDGAWQKSEQSRPMRDACKHAKITPPVGFHQLRHTWASLAVMAGMPLLVVARNLGHVDTRMVERHYGHLTESYVDEAIRAGAPNFGMVNASSVAPLRRKGTRA